MLRKPIIFEDTYYSNLENTYGYVYLTKCILSDKLYIGKHSHSEFDKSYYGSGKIMEDLKASLTKRGILHKNAFKTHVLCWASNKDELNQLEKYYISLFNAVDDTNFYNISAGGDGFTSEDVMGENNPFYGRTHSEYSKNLQSEHNFMKNKTGYKHPLFGTHTSEYQKQRTREANTGRIPWNKGIKCSDECKQKISESLVGKLAGDKNYFYGKHFYGSSNPRAISVVQLTMSNEFVREYSYLKETTKYGFAKPEEVSRCCKGLRSEYKGYKWVYKNDYERTMKNG